VGDTRQEFLDFVEPIIAVLRSPLMSGVIRGLTFEISEGRELSRAYRDEIVGPRLEQIDGVVSRGIKRGDLRPDTDVRLVHELLVGPVFYRLLYSGQPLDENLGTRVADAVLRAFRPD